MGHRTYLDTVVKRSSSSQFSHCNDQLNERIAKLTTNSTLLCFILHFQILHITDKVNNTREIVASIFTFNDADDALLLHCHKFYVTCVGTTQDVLHGMTWLLYLLLCAWFVKEI